MTKREELKLNLLRFVEDPDKMNTAIMLISAIQLHAQGLTYLDIRAISEEFEDVLAMKGVKPAK